MESNSSRFDLAGLRWSSADDAFSLADLHAATWSHAYAGIIPGAGLARMIARRGPSWWRRLHAFGGRALVVEHGDSLAGYALVGRSHSYPGGEIRELYVRPSHHGLGFGGRLFMAAHAELSARTIAPLTVWCLADNTLGAAFYRAKGGREVGRVTERIGGANLEKIRYLWT